MHPIHKVIITGTGRAGTTFLVRLLTELGLDTGYTRENWQRDYFAHCNAGLEHELTAPDAPYIVKNPGLADTLNHVLAEGRIAIDHAIIPVRELEAAAQSRIRIGGAHGNVPGGLLGTDDPARQKAVLAERFHHLVHTLVAHDVPHTFLHFPRFVNDASYTFTRLQGVLGDIDRATFQAAFERVAEPALVHRFTPGQAVSLGNAQAFQSAERTRRRRRRIRRAAGWSALAAALMLTLGWNWPGPPLGASRPMRGATAPTHSRIPEPQSPIASSKSIGPEALSSQPIPAHPAETSEFNRPLLGLPLLLAELVAKPISPPTSSTDEDVAAEFSLTLLLGSR